MKKALSVLLVIALLIGCLAGCGGSPGSDPSQSTDGNSSSSSSPAGSGEERLKIGIVLKTLASEYWVAMADGIKAKAEELGVDVEIMAAASESDTGNQLQMLEDMVSGDYDGIGVAPITDTNLINGVAKACSKGIPVVDLDQGFNEDELKAAGGWLVGYCTTDYVVTGRQAGEYLAGKMGNKGKAIIIEGMAGNLSSESRKTGCNEVLTKAGIEVVASQPCDWDRQKAMDATTNLLSVHPDVTGIYCCNDTMALGAQQAVDNLNLGDKVFVVGTDGNSEAIESIANGHMAGTAAQKPDVIGETCLEMLVEFIRSGKEGGMDYEMENVLLDSYIISPDNVAEHQKK
ncbi:sugar ABC transporter substrate-binding protein [Zongyangia hominis]|uniref:Substrate-binding domain-containing protein n=1 Tax=Zongyangia hominis TaxID=2763677 RepID=A0A926ECU6_9FIRM|nr:substrate-binding domain-containing protein [Zongyangia hominis]MBC8570713.1 substrate-binding domain-containing protein [Zongyangia hominis]